MTRISDEQLSAWLDGALPPEEAAQVEAAVLADPALAERAADWQSHDNRISAAFAPIAAQPIDAAMLKRLGLADSPKPQAANDNFPWWRRHAGPLGGAIAASFIAAAVLLQNGGTGGPADQGLSLALETTPSLGTTKLADGRELKPVLTVRAANGRYCREYRLGDQGGLACRGSDGWKVEASAPAGQLADPGNIGLAGGADGSALAPAYARIGAGDPLGAAEEAALLEGKWKGR